MGQLLKAFCIIFPSYEEQRVKKSIKNFKNNVDIHYMGNSYSFYCEDNSYILKAKKRVSRREIEELSGIISSTLGFKPICFCDIYTKENGRITVNPTIEWSVNQPPHVIESNIRSSAEKTGKVIVYPNGEFLIKTWGLNTFNPILFGTPPFINFEEKVKTCDEADLYLIIDVLARYNLCVNDKTWKDRKYNKADINKYYEMAILETNRFIGEMSYPINRNNPSEIVHTKEYVDWFYDWKEYFDNNEIINSYIGLKKDNSNYRVKRLPYSAIKS